MPMPPGRMTFALILSEDLFVYAKDLFIAASDWLVQKMTGVAVMAVTERLRGN